MAHDDSPRTGGRWIIAAPVASALFAYRSFGVA